MGCLINHLNFDIVSYQLVKELHMDKTKVNNNNVQIPFLSHNVLFTDASCVTFVGSNTETVEKLLS